MQRLTKYPLLLKAILSKTSAHDSRMKLQSIISTVNDFVGKINSTLRYQDEVEKVKVVSQRLATKCVYRDVPSGWEKVSNIVCLEFYASPHSSTCNLTYTWTC